MGLTSAAGELGEYIASLRDRRRRRGGCYGNVWYLHFNGLEFRYSRGTIRS